MEETILDMAVDEGKIAISDLMALLRSEFTSTKPFRAKKVSDEEALRMYESMQVPQMDAYIAEHGEQETNEYIKRMEELKGQRNG